MELKEAIIIFVIFDALVVAGVLFLVLRVQSRKYAGLCDIIRQVALKRGGSVSQARFAFIPLLEFPLEDLTVRVRFSLGGENSPPSTTIETRLNPQRKIRLYIFKENELSHFGKKFGLNDIQTHDPEFDDKFLISGNDPLWIANALVHEIRQALLNIKEKNPVFSLVSKTLTLNVSGLPQDEAELENLLDHVAVIIRKIREVI